MDAKIICLQAASQLTAAASPSVALSSLHCALLSVNFDNLFQARVSMPPPVYKSTTLTLCVIVLNLTGGAEGRR